MFLRTNLASVPFANRRPILAACLVIIAASAWFGVRLNADLQKLQRESHILETEVRRQDQQIAALQARIPPPVRKEQLGADERMALQSASGLIESRLFSWTRLLKEIEGELANDVRLTSITVSLADLSKVDALNPGRAPLRVSMVLVGKDLQQVLETIDRMRKSGRFTKFVPRKESVVEGTEEIEYEIDSTYAPS